MTLRYNLLEEPLIRTRLVAGGEPRAFTLPGLLAALGQDLVRDFPALRPHQRHPWHAFLVQLAAIALHRAGRGEPFGTEAEWKQALLDLTPDSAAWYLIAPHDRPAFMQAPVPEGDVCDWDETWAADGLDMLVTARNHDLKAYRIQRPNCDDWVMTLVSLQTQEGYGGKKNWGISRMAGGFGCRVAVGVVPRGNAGSRWNRDVVNLLAQRGSIVELCGLLPAGGHELLWLLPWDGSSSLTFSSLGPFYLEICRLVRLDQDASGKLFARTSSSAKRRIAEHKPSGSTGDAWTPIDAVTGEALRVRKSGFEYQLASSLLFGHPYRNVTYRQPIAMALSERDGNSGISVLMQAISRGGPQGNKSVTEGYHERRIPLSPKVRQLFLRKETDQLAAAASFRVKAIGEVRSMLWTAIATLFDQGAGKAKFSDSAKNKAGDFSAPFEKAEDARFFTDLNDEIEADDPESERLEWLVSLADRAEAVLRRAFAAGPQCGEQRYRAQAAALARFHGALRSSKSPLPDLANHLRQQSNSKESFHE